MTEAATGLPDLPGGHFWRVEPTSVAIRRTIRDSKWEKGYGWDDCETRIRVVGWWPFLKDIHEYRMRSKLVWITYADPLLDANGEVQMTDESRAGWHPREVIKRHPIDHSNILTLTQRAVEAWQADSDRRALLGDYPPKRYEIPS